MADDKELNRWCSLKKALRLKKPHEEINEAKMYQERRKNINLMKKILPSLFKNPEEEEEKESEEICKPLSPKKDEKQTENETQQQIRKRKISAESAVNEPETKKKKKKKKKKKNKTQAQNSVDNSNIRTKDKPKFKKENKEKKLNKVNELLSIGEETLKGYGMNPKKFKNKCKYRMNM